MNDRQSVSRPKVVGRSGPRMRRPQGTEHGFTLVELLVVITILGILSAVVVFAVRGSGKNAKEVAVATDARIVRTALETYCATYDRYPSNDPPGAAMGELVAKRFLSAPSDLNRLETGGSELPDGNCNGTKYKLTPNDTPGGSPSIVGPSTACGTPNAWCAVASQPPAHLGNSRNSLVQLPDGKVLAIETGTLPRRLMVYDPNPGDGSLGKWAPTASDPPFGGFGGFYDAMAVVRGTDAQCFPNCNKVLVAGGSGRMALYDPAGDTWTDIPPPADDPDTSMSGAFQIIGSACEAACGKFLAFGYKYDSNGDRFYPLYLWSPKTMTYDTVGNLPYNSYNPYALSDGRVVLSVGTKVTLFDPASRSAVPGPDAPCYFDDQVAGSLPNGKIMFPCNINLAIYNGNPNGNTAVLPQQPCNDLANPPAGTYCPEAAVYDPYDGPTGKWSKMPTCGHLMLSATAPGNVGGWCRTVASLPDGRVLAAATNQVDRTETWLYGPNPGGGAGQWTWTQTLPQTNQNSNGNLQGLFLSGSACGKVCNSVLAVGNPSTYTAPARSDVYQPPAG